MKLAKMVVATRLVDALTVNVFGWFEDILCSYA